MLNGLPGGNSVTARVANCLPLGADSKNFLIGASLYTHGNVWGIIDPPEDWKAAAENTPTSPKKNPMEDTAELRLKKKAWPYNLFSEGNEVHSGRK